MHPVRRASRRLVPQHSTRPPLRRIYWTLGQLRAGRPLKASDIAEKFEVGVRTAYRDFDFLRDAMRAPIEYDRPANTWRLTEPTASLPAITLSQGELVALYFAERVLEQYRGTPYERDLEAAFQKIATFLPDEVRVLPDKLLGYLSLHLGPLPAPDPGVFREIASALTSRRRLRIVYRSHSSGRTLERLVEPYRIFNLRGLWYLAAWDHRRREVRDFALQRIRKATQTDERYTIDPAFDFVRYTAAAFSIEKGERPVNVTIRFSPRQARWIRERRWHPSARIQERLDGGCILRMRLAPTSELLRWVMQFGADAELLAPKRLRADVARGLSRAARLYAK